MFICIQDDGVELYAMKSSDDDDSDAFEIFLAKIIEDRATAHPERRWPGDDQPSLDAVKINEARLAGYMWRRNAIALLEEWDWAIVEAETWLGTLDENREGLLGYFGAENERIGLSLPQYPFDDSFES